MNAIIIFFAILLISISAYAQPTNNVASSEKPSSDTTEVTKEPAGKSGKVVVPPEKLRPIVIPITQSEILIDGRLDEPAWQTAAVFKDFYQTSPGDNTKPSRPTEAYVFYDEKHLYIGFKCWDERDKIRATVAKRTTSLARITYASGLIRSTTSGVPMCLGSIRSAFSRTEFTPKGREPISVSIS